MKSRFWLAALLILIPVIGLAGMAVYGLKQHEKSVEAQAMRDCRIQTIASTWSSILGEALEASPRVVLYDAIPVPQPPSPEALALDAALAAYDESSLCKLCNFNPQAPPHSQLPALVCLVWRHGISLALPNLKSTSLLPLTWR